MMRTKLIAVLLASALAACTTTPTGPADRGVAAVNEPVLTRATYMIDVAAPGGVLPPQEVGRLEGWFQSLGLGFGDSVFVDGAYADTARVQVAEIASRYGVMLLQAAPVTAGALPPDMVRVVVARNRAEVSGCPNWSVPSQPNFLNRSMSNFGCAVNANLAAQVANPEDLFHGREGDGTADNLALTKAIQMYRDWPLTGIRPGQSLRPLIETSTTEEQQ